MAVVFSTQEGFEPSRILSAKMNPSWGFKLGGGFRYPFDELYDDRLWYFPKASEIVDYHMSHAQVDYFVIPAFGIGIGIQMTAIDRHFAPSSAPPL
jgi:hypothetical protein